MIQRAAATREHVVCPFAVVMIATDDLDTLEDSVRTLDRDVVPAVPGSLVQFSQKREPRECELDPRLPLRLLPGIQGIVVGDARPDCVLEVRRIR